MSITNDLIDIQEKLCYDLWNMVDFENLPRVVSPKLIFPDKGISVRYSEQEARTLFCNIIKSICYYYSIETPTKEQYLLTGQSKTRASTDLTLWTKSQKSLARAANIEFKSHAANKISIDKDILKLVHEKIPGGWIHLLKNMDSGTITQLFKKFRSAFTSNTYSQKNNVNFNQVDISIVFCFCVIEKRIGFIKHFKCSSKSNLNTYVNQFFQIDPTIKQGNVEIVNPNGWKIVSL